MDEVSKSEYMNVPTVKETMLHSNNITTYLYNVYIGWERIKTYLFGTD